MQETILITNHHPDGFAFALNEAGEQIFIPPYAIDVGPLERGKRYQAVLVENHKENQRERTPWMAVSVLAPEGQVKPDPIEVSANQVPTLDELVYKAICDSDYLTTSELAEMVGTDTTSASNSANRLFAAGQIAKADVYNRSGQARSSFQLWAKSASKFTV